MGRAVESPGRWVVVGRVEEVPGLGAAAIKSEAERQRRAAVAAQATAEQQRDFAELNFQCVARAQADVDQLQELLRGLYAVLISDTMTDAQKVAEVEQQIVVRGTLPPVVC